MRPFLLAAGATALLACAPAAFAADADAYRDAFVAFKSQDYKKAEAACDRALAADPNDAHAYVLKGRVAAAQGDDAKAEPLIRKGIQLQPGLTAAHRALGDLRFQERRYAEARLSYLDAQRYGDTDKDAALLILYCDVGLKNLGEAERLFVGFNPFDESNPDYYFAKAALSRLKGEEAESKKALQDATVLYGSAVFARYARAYFFLFAAKS